jgi:hypothetical protein
MRVRHSKRTSRRAKAFRRLEHKARFGVILGAAFICLVAAIAVYLGINPNH